MGIINAAQNIGMKKPIIIRLKGTNVDEAKKLIEVPDSLLFHRMFEIILPFMFVLIFKGFWIPSYRYR